MSWDLLKFCGFEKVQFFLCVFWGRVGRHPGTIYKETHRICKIHVFQDDITKIQANESISLIHWKWLISKRSILGTLFAKPSVSIRKIAGLPGDSGNARCLQTCCMARFSTYMVAFDCMASEKKRWNIDSLKHRRITGLRTLEWIETFKWEVNLDGNLHLLVLWMVRMLILLDIWFSAVLLYGEDLQELHLRHFKNISKETPLKFNSELIYPLKTAGWVIQTFPIGFER